MPGGGAGPGTLPPMLGGCPPPPAWGYGSAGGIGGGMGGATDGAAAAGRAGGPPAGICGTCVCEVGSGSWLAGDSSGQEGMRSVDA